MTPRVDKAFSEELLQRASLETRVLDFRAAAPLFPFPHPLVLKAQISHQNNPQQEYPVRGSFMVWNLFCFEDASEVRAEEKFLRGSPSVISQILQELPVEVVIHFDQLGCVMLTQNKMLMPTKAGFHQMSLPLALDYVFSQDLWASHGKWTLFHARLKEAFKKADLLLETSPGFYSLNKKALRLNDHGISGDEFDSHFDLTLPWTFSLSDLVKLESLLKQEF